MTSGRCAWLVVALLFIAPADTCPSICRCDAGNELVYCNDKNLTSVPSGIPENTHVLYLQDNLITAAGIPLAVKNLTNLKLLYLYGNRLESFPINLPTGLLELHLQMNKLRRISREVLSQIRLLEKLHLDDNDLATSEIEQGAFRELSSIKGLYFSSNQLLSVPYDLPKSLEELQLESNRITTILEDTFEGMVNLKHLNLDWNALTSEGIHDSSFADLTELEELSLANNLLTSPPRILPGTNLQKLHLQHNNITTIPSNSFLSLHNLVYLDLSENHIKSLPVEAFSGLNNLKQLTLQNNPWLCDRKLLLLKDFLETSTVHVNGFICNEPHYLKGETYKAIRPEMLNSRNAKLSTSLMVMENATLGPTTKYTTTHTSSEVAETTSAGDFTANQEGKTTAIPTLVTTTSNTTSETTMAPTTDHLTSQSYSNPVLRGQSMGEQEIKVEWEFMHPNALYNLSWTETENKTLAAETSSEIVYGSPPSYVITKLRAETAYRICLELIRHDNMLLQDTAAICTDARTNGSLPNNLTLFLNQDQTILADKGLPIPVAGLVGGSVASVLVLVLLGALCWYSHKTGRYFVTRRAPRKASRLRNVKQQYPNKKRVFEMNVPPHKREQLNSHVHDGKNIDNVKNCNLNAENNTNPLNTNELCA
ncbi:leucine-rich repeat transmembrane protein FLRT3-like [Lampetra planeri]